MGDDGKAKLPPNCPQAEIVKALKGRIGPGFNCHVCLVSPLFCTSYQLGHPEAVAYQQAWLEFLTRYHCAKK